MAIQANELRIGNWVRLEGFKEANPFQITIKSFQRNLWDYDPIALTPEILEKAGFKKLPHFTVQNSMQLDIGRDRFVSVGNVGTPNEMIFLTEEERPKVNAVIVLKNFDYDGKTYLHTLQNLIFSLTGQELQIETL